VGSEELGKCGVIFGRGGDAGAAVHKLEAAVAFSFILGKKEAGRGPRDSERRWWRRAGSAGGQGLVGREVDDWAWEKEAAQERRRGSGPAEGQGLGGWAKNRRWAQAQKEILFEFQLILEFGRTLENCTRRFRKKFDMGIFPKIF
jgi:hypothetical protein